MNIEWKQRGVTFYPLSEEKALNEAIDEAMGISAEVEKESERIVDAIQTKLRGIYPCYNRAGVYLTTVALTDRLFDDKVTIKVRAYFFRDEHCYLYNLKKSMVNYIYSYVHSSSTIYLTAVVVGGDFVPGALRPKVAHEIRHVLQYKKTKQGRNELPHTQKYYTIRNMIMEGGLKSAVANIVYLSSKYEQESYGEELYNELMYSNAPYQSYVFKTNPYMAYTMLRESIEYIEQNKNSAELLSILGKYGYQYKFFIAKAKKAKDRFLKRLSRAVAQAVSDKNK